jgi:hypothetical protein
MTRTDVLESRWKMRDYLGAIRVRLGPGRSRYRVTPGLYRTGTPDKKSPVFVTANYKLSVDHLRKSLEGLAGWILIIDTKGVNVWCAAGKGSFGTDTLVRQISESRLESAVEHRKLILPQLGAPGIDGGAVKKESGFSVVYGPVEAKDLKRFLNNSCNATPEMRRKRFPLSERFLVSFTHFSQTLLPALIIALLFTAADLLFHKAGTMSQTLIRNALLSAGSIFSGSILVGVLLPILPGRAFSVKSITPALLFSLGAWLMIEPEPKDLLYTLSKIVILSVWICYQGLNLTGSSTFTSLSGVQKEMRIAVPVMITALLAGLAGVIAGGVIT